MSEVAQSCLTSSDPMDCSLPGSSVHGIFQASVLEWGAIAFSRIISLEYIYYIMECPLYNGVYSRQIKQWANQKNIYIIEVYLMKNLTLFCKFCY